MDALSTKDKIIEAASQLFSEKGFPGTSIRDIAAEAQVNLAAINYHFTNKQRLLFEVLKKGYEKLRADIHQIDTQKSSDPVLFVTKVFEVLIKDKGAVVNMMRLMLSSECQQMDRYGLDDEVYGPPGSIKLLEVIENSLGRKLTKKDATWIVRALFTQVFHKALMVCSAYCQRESVQKDFNLKEIKQQMQRTTQVLLNTL